MDAFSYLSVLLSIIIGLGMTQILTASGRLIRGREHVRLYMPPLVWAAMLIVIDVQMWWSMFGLRTHESWTFTKFFVVIMQTVFVYMMAALALPESVDERGVDLHEHFERQRLWFFGFFLATLLTSIAKDWVIENRLPEPKNLLFHGILFVVAVLGMILRTRRAQQMLAVAGAVILGVYVLALFATLQ